MNVSDRNMAFASNLMTEDSDVPDRPFIDVLTEHCQLIHEHIKTSNDCLMMLSNISETVATVKLFDRNLEESQLLHITISNHTDLKEQLYHLWIEVRGILRNYSLDNHTTS